MKRQVVAIAALSLGLFGPLGVPGAQRLARAEAPSAAPPAGSVGPASAPPPGWEPAPPLLTPAPPRGGKAAGCCKFNQDCCIRQSEMNATPPEQPIRVLTVDHGALPLSTAREVKQGEPTIDDAPPLRFLDSLGRPPPWPGSPSGDVRLMPPGRFGEIIYNDSGEPFFEDKEARSMGYGVIHNMSEKGGGTLAQLVGKVRYVSLRAGEADAVTLDVVEGALGDKLDLHATLWIHAEAARVGEGFLNAYRGVEGGTDRVTVVLPEVVRGFESAGVLLRGGFFPSRFSRSVSFTTYGFPTGPNTGETVRFVLFDGEGRRWFGKPRGFAPPGKSIIAMISVSQTGVEPEPRIRILLFARS